MQEVYISFFFLEEVLFMGYNNFISISYMQINPITRVWNKSAEYRTYSIFPEVKKKTKTDKCVYVVPPSTHNSRRSTLYGT